MREVYINEKRLKFITAFLLIGLLVVGNGLPTGVYALTDSGADIEIEATVAAPAFDALVSYDIDASAASVAKGDYNSDGVLDLILTHENGNAFSCIMGNEDGTFASPQVTSTINYPTSPCPGDFNEDGKLDLAFVSGQTHGLHIHLGNGDGTFQPQNVNAVGTSPGRVMAAEVNQDGKLDLIVANYHSDNISVLTGNGDGTFNSHVDIPTGDGPSDIEAKDFNGDGKVDIAVLNNYDESFSILINNSADHMVSFSTGTTYILDGSEPWGGSKDLASLLASDLVGNDGIADLAMTVCLKGDLVSYILIYEGIGDGTFQQVYAGETGKQAYDIVLGDFNSDNLPDLAMTNRYYSTVVILCKTDDSWQSFDNYPAGSTPNQIVTGDFNDDGLDDLAVANPNNVAALTILLQSNDGGGDDTCIIAGCDTLISAGGFADSDIIDGKEYYCVDNAKQLAHIHEHFDENNECNLNFVQTADIDLSVDFGNGWTPIGGFDGGSIFLGNYRG
ncbi:MAG TPA: VCBS repeat-containing protein, partial [Anaerovoracaceae bacterium]|nr:VCBS repeat-containing protein [Anaerovoracaceae bacterium]